MGDDGRSIRRQRSIYRVHYALCPRQAMAQPWPRAAGGLVQAYQSQVAGHTSDGQDEYLGLLQCNNGTIMKPLLKPAQTREVDFYNRLQGATSRDLLELREFVPKYFGNRQYAYNGYQHDYIVLEDLALRMLEPCIMDVKIGKRTWDPLADEQKITREQSKYTQCRQEYAFCIPGYQVYKLNTGKLYKYGKEHGKKLHGKQVKEAIRNYLNINTSGVSCRALLLQVLSELWRVAAWAARQRALRVFAASLLIVYDAAKLRECCGEAGGKLKQAGCVPSTTPIRRKSVPAMPSGSNFSGQLDSKGPVYKKVNSVPITPIQLTQQSFSNFTPINSEWSEALKKSNKTHSFENNYESKITKMKMNYYSLLDKLSCEEEGNKPWATVKIIDFAHAFFNDDGEDTVDNNFREGIENLVTIFEELLKETDDVF